MKTDGFYARAIIIRQL